MKFKTILFSILLITTSSCIGQENTKKLVNDAYNNYKTAILNDKGEEAVKYVDSRTIKYYNDILELVKNADSVTVTNLSILDKLMVFTIRHTSTKKDILSFDGKGLLIYAIKNGMVGKNSVSNNTIGEIKIDSNFAKGQFITNGQKTNFYFHFYKEDEQWKIDLTSIFPLSTLAFKKLVTDSGQNENDYLFSLLEILTGIKPGKEIWNKLN